MDIKAFERLLGPCMDIMKRNIANYEEQLVTLFGSQTDTEDENLWVPVPQTETEEPPLARKASGDIPVTKDSPVVIFGCTKSKTNNKYFEALQPYYIGILPDGKKECFNGCSLLQWSPVITCVKWHQNSVNATPQCYSFPPIVICYPDLPHWFSITT